MNFISDPPKFRRGLFFLVCLLIPAVFLAWNIQQQYRRVPLWVVSAWYTLKAPSVEQPPVDGYQRDDHNYNFEDTLHWSRPGEGDRWGIFPAPSNANKVVLRTATGQCAGQQNQQVIVVDCRNATGFTPEVDTRTGRTLVRFLDEKGRAVQLFDQDPRLKAPENTWWEANRVCATGPHFPWVEYRCTKGFLWGAFGVAALISVWFLSKCWQHMPRKSGARAPQQATSRLAQPFFWMTVVQVLMMAAYLLEIVPDSAQVALWGRMAVGVLQFCLAVTMLHVSLELAEHPDKTTWLRWAYGLCVLIAVVFALNPFGWVYLPGYFKGTAAPIHELRMTMGPLWSTVDMGRSIALYLGFSIIFQNYPYLAGFFQRQTKWLTFMVLLPVVFSWLVWRFSVFSLPGLDVGYIISVTLPSFMLLVMFKWFDLKIFEVTSAPPTKLLIAQTPPLLTVDRNGMVTWMSLQASALFPEVARNLPVPFKGAPQLAALQGDGLPDPEGQRIVQLQVPDEHDQDVLLTKDYQLTHITNTGLKDVLYAQLLLDVTELVKERRLAEWETRRAEDLAKFAYTEGKRAEKQTILAEEKSDTLKIEVAQKELLNEQLKKETRKLRQTQHELEQANQKLELMTVTDDLTSWRNRRGYRTDWDFHQARLQGQNFQDVRLGLVYFDLDDFRRYNNENSHLAGDEILVQVTQHLHQVLVEQVGEGKFHAFRMSGEEFCVMLPDQDLSFTHDLAELMRTSLKSRRFQVHHNNTMKDVEVTASFGVAAAPQHDWHSLLAWVDAAARQAKAMGKDRVFVYPHWILGLDH